MGQKVHPYGFRLGFNRTWHSNWIAKRDYADLLHEDLKLKKELKGRFAGAGVSHSDRAAAEKDREILLLRLENALLRNERALPPCSSSSSPSSLP